jgi:hypothetical protein
MKKYSKEAKEKEIKIDITACNLIYDLFKDMKKGSTLDSVSKKLDFVLDTPAYVTMFKHYNRDWRPHHLPKDVFKRMILSVAFQEQYTLGENERADHMLEKWNYYYNNINEYKNTLQKLQKSDLRKMIKNSIKEAQSWLPPEMKIKYFDFFINPNGSSPGYIINESQGYDFFQLPEKIDCLGEIIAHECHHAGLNIPNPEFRSKSDSVAFNFLKIFVGEGTANKFIDNVPGGCVPPVRNDKKFRYLNQKMMNAWENAWRKYTSSEDKLFQRMIDTFSKAYSGSLTEEGLKAEMSYWFTGTAAPAYFAGSELFGAVYYAFRKKGAFEAMRDPRRIFDLYNKSIQKERQVLSNCPVIPESIVEKALSIGS